MPHGTPGYGNKRDERNKNRNQPGKRVRGANQQGSRGGTSNANLSRPGDVFSGEANRGQQTPGYAGSRTPVTNPNSSLGIGGQSRGITLRNSAQSAATPVSDLANFSRQQRDQALGNVDFSTPESAGRSTRNILFGAANTAAGASPIGSIERIRGAIPEIPTEEIESFGRGFLGIGPASPGAANRTGEGTTGPSPEAPRRIGELASPGIVNQAQTGGELLDTQRGGFAVAEALTPERAQEQLEAIQVRRAVDIANQDGISFNDALNRVRNGAPDPVSVGSPRGFAADFDFADQQDGGIQNQIGRISEAIDSGDISARAGFNSINQLLGEQQEATIARQQLAQDRAELGAVDPLELAQFEADQRQNRIENDLSRRQLALDTARRQGEAERAERRLALDIADFQRAGEFTDEELIGKYFEIAELRPDLAGTLLSGLPAERIANNPILEQLLNQATGEE